MIVSFCGASEACVDSTVQKMLLMLAALALAVLDRLRGHRWSDVVDCECRMVESAVCAAKIGPLHAAANKPVILLEGDCLAQRWSFPREVLRSQRAAEISCWARRDAAVHQMICLICLQDFLLMQASIMPNLVMTSAMRREVILWLQSALSRRIK